MPRIHYVELIEDVEPEQPKTPHPSDLCLNEDCPLNGDSCWNCKYGQSLVTVEAA